MKHVFDIILPAPKELTEKPNMTQKIFPWYALFIFFVITVSYFELIYRIFIFRTVDGDYIFSVLFALSAAAIFFLASVFASRIKNGIITTLITLALTVLYSAQFVYFFIFKTPFSLYSLIGVKDATQFWDVAVSAILNNGLVIALFFIPIVFLFLFRKKFFLPQRPKLFWLQIVTIALIGIISYEVSIFGMRATSGKDFSQYTVYYNIASPELSMKKIGVLTTMRLDLQRALFSFEENSNQKIVETPTPPPPVAQKKSFLEENNVMKIDFAELFKNEQNRTLLDMHAYFASNIPTKKNSRTGMFKGKNLIVMLAESFSPYAISPELTPTLYKMSTEGFVFNNFYNPIGNNFRRNLGQFSF